MTGAVILAFSLRILFDSEYSHLLFHGSGNYLAGHVLVASGISLVIVCLIGCTGIVKGSSCLLGLVFFPSLKNLKPFSQIKNVFRLFYTFYFLGYRFSHYFRGG